MKLIILAAGKGTRFYPLTKQIPKGLIPLGDKTLLDHVTEPYLSSVSDIIIVINDELGHMIEKHFGTSYKNHKVSYIIQTKDHRRGTLSALSLCKEIIGEEIFCVSNCDDLLLEEDINTAINSGVPGMGISKTVMPYRYLGIDTENGVTGNIITGFRRHAKEDGEFVEDFFSNGFYILTPEIFNFPAVEILDGELGLPHTLFANIKNYPLQAFDFKKWQSVNGPENLEAAERFIYKRER